MSSPDYYVYILECADGTLYTGVTTDLERRIQEHNEGKVGAAYTRSRRPVKLAYVEKSSSRSEAQRREYAIKQLTRAERLALIAAATA